MFQKRTHIIEMMELKAEELRLKIAVQEELERDSTSSFQTIQNFKYIIENLTRMVKILKEHRTRDALERIVGPALNLNKDTMELILDAKLDDNDGK